MDEISGECVPGVVGGASCKFRQYSQEGTTGRVELEPGLLGEPSRQGERYMQRPRGGTVLASSRSVREAGMAGVTQGD